MKTLLGDSVIGTGIAGYGPREIAPGAREQLFRANGSDLSGMHYSIAFHTENEDLLVGATPEASPLIATVRFGLAGSIQQMECDVREGTVITVPGSMVDVSVRNAGVEGVGYARRVTAHLAMMPYFKPGNAQISFQDTVVQFTTSPVRRIPDFAIGVRVLMRDRGADGTKFLRFLDSANNIIAQTGCENLATARAPIPNGITKWVIDNSDGALADNIFSTVFELSF